MGVKANHHYVPQFYLRGFATGVGRKARVFTFDSETREAFTTLVRNVGSKRHFNRIDAEGRDPNYVEDALAEIEGEISAHLSQVIAARAFPSDEHFNSVMNLIAQASVRNPRLRGVMEKFHKDIAQTTMNLVMSSKEIWETQTKKMRDDGYPVNDDVSYEDSRKFLEEGNYDILIDQTHLIATELEMLPTVLETLANRNWCFATADSENHYICSDDPVALSWTNELDGGRMSPGHGLKGTSILFPLSSDLLLIGAFENLPGRVEHDDSQVTVANTRIARHSTKQIYARDGLFRLHLKDQRDVKGEDLPKIYGN